MLEQMLVGDHVYLNFRNTADFLKVHVQTLENMVKARKITPDLVLRNTRYFKKAELEVWQEVDGYSFDEIAARYGLTKRAVFYHFRTKRDVPPDLVRSGKMLFCNAVVSKIAEREGWQLCQQIIDPNVKTMTA